MTSGIHKEYRKFNTIFLAFFTAGFVESLFPHLNQQISDNFPDEPSVRILLFTGLISLSILSVLFGMTKNWTGRPVNLLIAVLLIIPGLFFLLISMQSILLALLSALFLFSSSLFIQIAGLQYILSSIEKRKIAVNIALLYFIKATGLLAGLSLPLILSSLNFEGRDSLLFSILVLAILSGISMVFIPFRERESKSAELSIKFTFRHLLADKFVLLIVGGLIVYTGAEFCLVNLIPFYFSETFGIKILQMIIPGVGLFTFCFVIGRLAGVIILGKTKPGLVFLFSCVLSILGLFSMFIGQKYISLAGTVLIGLGISNIFPVMVSMTLERKETDKRVLIGMMIGTIPVGALFPALMWAVTASISIAMSFTVPVFCMFCITWIAIMLFRRRT